MKKYSLILLPTLVSACISQPPQTESYLINTSEQQELSCKQLENKIEKLERAPKTETLAPDIQSNTPFTFKNKYTGHLKSLKRAAAKKGCYDQPAFIPKARPETAPKLIDTQRQQLNFDQCFAKCKELTSRNNEQCFDSCK